MKKKYMTPNLELLEILGESVCDDDDVVGGPSDEDNIAEDGNNDGYDGQDEWE